MQLPMALAGSDPLFLGRLDAGAILPALTLGAAGLTSHYCLTNAFRAGDATVVVPIDFLRIPLIATVGWLFYGESVDIFVFAGAALIICGVLWNLRAESQRATRPDWGRKRPPLPMLDCAITPLHICATIENHFPPAPRANLTGGWELQ